MQTGSILLLQLMRILARSPTKLKSFKRAASRGVTFTAMVSSIKWTIRFSDSSLSFSAVENLARQHDMKKSYAIPFHLSGEETSFFPHSEPSDYQSPNNSSLENSTSIIQSTEYWHDEFSAYNDDAPKRCCDRHVIFKMTDRLFLNSKRRSKNKIIKEVAV